VFNTGNVIFLRTGERWGVNNITIKNVVAEVPATKPDAGYLYEGPVEDLPRNVSPGIIITGLPNKKITNVNISNIVMKHAGGGNALYAQVPLKQLDSIPELPAKYPEFSMFKELPAWGIYARHATGLKISNITMSTDKKDFRNAIVLDDIHQSQFAGVNVKQQGKADTYYLHKSTSVTTK
jgi:hypothetical protein